MIGMDRFVLCQYVHFFYFLLFNFTFLKGEIGRDFGLGQYALWFFSLILF